MTLLHFLSYGGSSLIGSAIIAGLILNYTKIKHIYMTNKKYLYMVASGGHTFPISEFSNH